MPNLRNCYSRFATTQVGATYTVQAEAIDTRVIGHSFSFLAWILT